MSQKRLMKSNSLAPHATIKGAGFNWDLGSIAFSDITLKVSKRERARDNEKKRYAKKKEADKLAMNAKHGPV
jgi:hypothetical protein